MIYVSAQQLIRINEAETRQGAPANVRDMGLVEGAAARPQQSAGGTDAFETIHEKAAALFEAVAQRQGFVDGNKRTAVLATYAFYGYNGYLFEDAPDGLLFYLAERLAHHEVDVNEVAREFEAVVTQQIPEPPNDP